MTLKIQGRSVADGNLGNITDFTQIEASEGRIFETVDSNNNLSTWIVESTDKGGNLISGGLYANQVTPLQAVPRPILSIPFGINQTQEFLNGSISCVRSTVKNYTDIYGIVRQAPVNNIAIEKYGALIEGSSTNSLLYSEDSSNAVWSKLGCTSVLDGESAPDLSLTANKIVESNNLGGHFILQVPTSQPIQGDICSFSFYFKPAERKGVLLRFVDESGGEVGAIFNSVTGDFSSVSPGVSTKKLILGDGWYRICISYAFSSPITSGSAGQCRAFILNDSLSGSYQGDGVSGFYLWGFQYEKLGFCTSYISTTSSASTRAADNITIPTLNNYLGVFQGAHTIYFKFSSIGATGRVLSGVASNGSIQRYWAFNDGSRILFRNGTAVTTNGLTVDMLNLNSFACTYDGQATRVYTNGVSSIDNTAAPSDNINTSQTITIGARTGASTENVYGYIKDLAVYDVNLNEAQINLLG